METCSSPWTEPGTGGLGAVLITNLLTAILRARDDLSGQGVYPADTSNFAPSYDFIVVGSGSAGSVVANRLSEVPDWSVLLLEAGGDPPLSVEIPSIFHSLQESHIDWGYDTEPQEFGCLGMKDRRCYWPRGKALGGSSNLNAMLYVRGNKRDYDRWTDMGFNGWSYREVLPFFKKSEGMKWHSPETPGADTYTEEYHGTNGYLTLEPFEYKTPIVEGLLDAVRELGYRVGDINGQVQTGFTLQHGTLINGTRCNTAKAFLAPVKHRKNLHVAKFAHVTRVLIDPDTKTARGVEFEKDGELHVVRCDKEVILSAGAVNSPQLLMLSGVGPKEHLQELGIPVIADLPVGDNMQDHVQVLGPTFLFNVSKPHRQEPVELLRDTYDFLMHRSGPLASLDILQVMGFVSTKLVHLDVPGEDPETVDYPDIQFQHIRFPHMDTENAARVSHITRYTDKVYETIFGIPNSQAEIYIPLTILQRPKSRGFLRLRSTNPKAAPIIDPRYLSDQRDVDTLVEGLKIAIAVGNTRALKERFQTVMSITRMPGCEDHDFATEQYWACYVRQVSTTIYHVVGTCSMGSVVDSELRVKGISGLRVIDASIMPTIVTGNTHAPTVMIGERGTDFVKRSWLQF